MNGNTNESSSAPLEAKVVFLGESLVGKTSIISAYSHDDFSDDYLPTVGAHFSVHNIVIGSNEVKLKVWDTAGQERFRALTPMYYKDSHIAVVVFAVDDQLSFEKVTEWIETVRKDTIVMPRLVIVGNKIDIERAVTSPEGEALAEKVGAVFVECSAKTRQGISELFVLIAENAIRLGQSITETQQLVEANPEGGKQKGCC
jgi:small GTP-binding protein